MIIIRSTRTNKNAACRTRIHNTAALLTPLLCILLLSAFTEAFVSPSPPSVLRVCTKQISSPTRPNTNQQDNARSISLSASPKISVDKKDALKETSSATKDLSTSSKQPTPRSGQQQHEDDLIFGLPRTTVFNPLALLLVSQFVLFIGVGAVIPAIPLYGKEIGLSGAANGIVISAPAVALLALANFSGRFSDKARKPAMITGMAIIVVSDIGTAMATSLPALVVARLGLGAGRGISEAGERGMLADLASQVPALRGRSLAAQQAVVALGIAIGAPCGGYILEEYGARAGFLCVSAAAFCALISYFFLPETTTMTSSEEDLADNSKDDNNQRNEDIVEWTTLLKDNRWKGLALCQCGASVGFAAKISSIPILAAAALPGGALGAGALLSAAGLSGLVGAPVGGWITDRAGAKFAAVASGIFSATALIGIPFALSGSSSIPALDNWIAHTTSLPNGLDANGLLFAVLVIGWSTAVAAQGPAMTALAQELAPKGSEATSMALPRAAGDGTYIVAPFILGLVADKAASSFGLQGFECAAAGSATLLGAVALAVLGNSSGIQSNGRADR